MHVRDLLHIRFDPDETELDAHVQCVLLLQELLRAVKVPQSGG